MQILIEWLDFLMDAKGRLMLQIVRNTYKRSIRVIDDKQ
jgi:hypothetical protein